MSEVKRTGKSEQQILNDRLRNSGSPTADIVHKAGDGARRTYTNIHQRGQGGAGRRVDLNDGGKATLDKDD